MNKGQSRPQRGRKSMNHEQWILPEVALAEGGRTGLEGKIPSAS
jgi:hypothetical protein